MEIYAPSNPIPITQEQIAKLQSLIGRTLPEEFTRFLLKHNGTSLARVIRSSKVVDDELLSFIAIRGLAIEKPGIYSEYVKFCGDYAALEFLDGEKFGADSIKNLLPFAFTYTSSFFVISISSDHFFGKVLYFSDDEGTVELRLVAEDFDEFLSGLEVVED